MQGKEELMEVMKTSRSGADRETWQKSERSCMADVEAGDLKVRRSDIGGKRAWEWRGVRSYAEETGAGKQDGEDWGGRVLEGQVRKRSKGQSRLTRRRVQCG
jgi:hypothetical protein